MSLLFNVIGGAMIGCGLWAFIEDTLNFKTMMVLGVGCIILLLVEIKDGIKEPGI
jgi:hypothetical protein